MTEYNNTDQSTGHVQFENEGYMAFKYYREPEPPKMAGLITKYSGGLIKDSRQASYVLLGIAILFFLLSFYFFSHIGNSSGNFPKVSPNGATGLDPFMR